MIKTLNRVAIEEMHLHIIKGIYDKPTADIILHSEKQQMFPQRSEIRQESPLSQLVSNIVLEVMPEKLGRKIKVFKMERKK